jgi:hypothetical protein
MFRVVAVVGGGGGVYIWQEVAGSTCVVEMWRVLWLQAGVPWPQQRILTPPTWLLGLTPPASSSASFKLASWINRDRYSLYLRHNLAPWTHLASRACSLGCLLVSPPQKLVR